MKEKKDMIVSEALENTIMVKDLIAKLQKFDQIEEAEDAEADYTEAARRGATVRLANGEEYTVHLVNAGVDGWLTTVIRAYDGPVALIWGTNGDVYVGEADIVEVL